MPAKQGEVMSRNRLKETITALTFIYPKPSESRLGRERPRSASSSSQNVADLMPYSPKDLKYLWALWDEAERHQQPGRRYRNIYVGAMGVILTGWLIHGMGLSFSAPLGSILMLAGALIGGWYCLKSLRQQRQSPPRG
jgi:hypothetical protein